MTGEQAFAKLEQLRDKAGAQHYERVKLAVLCLEDKAWVAANGGDITTVWHKLEDEVLADICGDGDMPLHTLTAIYRRFPRLEQWQQYKFSFAKMADVIAKENRRPTQRVQVPATTRRQGVLLTPDEVAQLSPARVLREYARVYRSLLAAEARLGRQRSQEEVA